MRSHEGAIAFPRPFRACMRALPSIPERLRAQGDRDFAIHNVTACFHLARRTCKLESVVTLEYLRKDEAIGASRNSSTSKDLVSWKDSRIATTVVARSGSLPRALRAKRSIYVSTAYHLRAESSY
jgi:S-adenosylhomocysteine hydrolase